MLRLLGESIIKARRPVIAKYVKSMVEAIHFIKTNKEATKAIIAKKLRMDDAEGLERAYKAYSAIFREAPYPYVEGVKTFMDDLAVANPKAASADLSRYVDMSFIPELDSSGFHQAAVQKQMNSFEMRYRVRHDSSTCPLFNSSPRRRLAHSSFPCLKLL